MARLSVRYLTPENREFVHEQVVHVLEDVGVAYNTPSLTVPLQEAGADVDPVALTEALSTVVLFQLEAPGCAIVSVAGGAATELRTGGYLAGTPEAALINVVCLEMSRFYGLPSGGSAITCDSRTCDLQAGVESALTGAACVLAGAEVLLAAGLVDGARTASLAKTVLDADTIAAITRMAHGDVVTPESALIEDILAVGIGGQFVTRPSSRRDGGSELWRPATWSREPTSGRTAGDLVREAAARAEDLIAASQTAPLPEEVLTLAEDILGRPLARVA